MTTLQRDLDDTARRLSVRAPIIATRGMLNITLKLGSRLDYRDDLGMGLHPFGLGHQTSAAQKALKARAEKHQVIADGGSAPSLSDMATLTAPDGVTLPDTLAMTRGSHARLRVIPATLFGTDHPTALAMKEVNSETMERETEIEEYNPRERGLKACLP